MEDFLKADGLSRIIFYFQEVENLPDAGNYNILGCLVGGRRKVNVCACMHKRYKG